MSTGRPLGERFADAAARAPDAPALTAGNGTVTHKALAAAVTARATERNAFQPGVRALVLDGVLAHRTVRFDSRKSLLPRT